MAIVTVLELPATWAAEREPSDVLADVDDALRNGRATDLVLLPEASLAGYVSPRGDFDVRAFSEPLSGPTVEVVRELARRHRAFVVAPLILAESDVVFNAMIGCAPDGELAFVYRKRHPWFPETWAEPGAEPPPLLRIADLDVTIAVCFDIHFAPRDMVSVLRGADLLLFPSAWVDGDEVDERTPILGALARQFDVWIANANWSPGVVGVAGQGGSMVIDRRGEIVARLDLRTGSDLGIGRIDVEIVSGT